MTAKIRRGAGNRLRWLAEHGCPVNILKDEPTIRIEQQLGDDATLLFDLPNGQAGCILDLAIINGGRGARCVRDLEFTMPWSDFGFHLLQDPREIAGPHYNNLYRFPGDSLEFDRDLVLNHVLLPDGVLQPHLPMRGLLLGVGNPLSPHISHGARFTGTLTVFIEGGDPTSSGIELWVDRLMNPQKMLRKRRAAYEGLYGDNLRSGQAPARRSKRDIPNPLSRGLVPDAGQPNKKRQ